MMSRDDLELDKLGGYKETKLVYNRKKGEYEKKYYRLETRKRVNWKIRL